jgi:hypothetical protein
MRNTEKFKNELFNSLKEHGFLSERFWYFIENRENTDYWWWYPEWGHEIIYSFCGTPCGSQPSMKTRWTKDPQKAYRFKTKKQAEDMLDVLYLWKNTAIVTEHEFTR